MRLVLDMNISPAWVVHLTAQNWDVVHWSTVGDARATDEAIFRWARQAGRAVVTADLGFGRLLALTGMTSPSVVEMRAGDILSASALQALIAALGAHAADIEAGALVVVEPARSRVRLLPFK
ncbi:MAG: DUF5615 family PIN-like protein [Planctomycetes bacterium]|nr:DUF5615 family PIN-like protein [Planctomycetota bacterium]